MHKASGIPLTQKIQINQKGPYLICKTKEANVLIEMARKLEDALKLNLYKNIEISRNVENVLLDIRDMEETTDEKEIIDGIIDAFGEINGSRIKVRNIRNYYGGTKQALVEVPANLAIALLNKGRLKVGLVICRVRKNLLAKRCFLRQEQGYLARTCQAIDRSQTCRICGIDGHKSNTCDREPRCIICLEAGRKEINHYIGSGSMCR